MGAAFLLLETRYVTGFALLFGSTWLVNALVFAGVLVAVLCAVETSRRIRPRSLTPLYVLLAGTLVVAYSVPLSALLSLAAPLRVVAAIALAFAPIFCANLVFAARFADTSGSPAAFGANLLGALLGGTLEYASLVVGYRALILLAAALYLLAFALKPPRLLTRVHPHPPGRRLDRRPDVTSAQHRLALGTTGTSLTFLATILVLVVYLTITRADRTEVRKPHHRAGAGRSHLQ